MECVCPRKWKSRIYFWDINWKTCSKILSSLASKLLHASIAYIFCTCFDIFISLICLDRAGHDLAVGLEYSILFVVFCFIYIFKPIWPVNDLSIKLVQLWIGSKNCTESNNTLEIAQRTDEDLTKAFSE